MIKRLSQAGVPVLDQDSAKAFYTEKLGFDVRTDLTMDGFRWLTVGPPDQPDFEFVLWYPGPPMYDEETAQQIRALVAKGAISGGVWEADDCKKTFEELSAKESCSSRSRRSGRMGLRHCSATIPATGSAWGSSSADGPSSTYFTSADRRHPGALCCGYTPGSI